MDERGNDDDSLASKRSEGGWEKHPGESCRGKGRRRADSGPHETGQRSFRTGRLLPYSGLLGNAEENGIVLSFYVLKIPSEPQLTVYKFMYVSA